MKGGQQARRETTCQRHREMRCCSNASPNNPSMSLHPLQSEGPGPRYTSYIYTHTYRCHAGPRFGLLSPANHASISSIIISSSPPPSARLAHDATLLHSQSCVCLVVVSTDAQALSTEPRAMPRIVRRPCLSRRRRRHASKLTPPSLPSLPPLPPTLPPANHGGPSTEKGAKSSQHYGRFLLESHPRREPPLHCLPCLPHQEQHQVLGGDATMELQAKIRLPLPHLLLLRPRLSRTRLGGG